MRWMLGVVMALLGGCSLDSNSDLFQGYVSTDLTYVSSEATGQLEQLRVSRGQNVDVGQGLFSLDEEPEHSALIQGEAELERARSDLADLSKGKRKPFLQAIDQQIQELDARLMLARKTLQRQKSLYRQQLTQRDQLDKAQSEYQQLVHQRDNISQQLEIAKLPARDDQIVAAQKMVHAKEAALSQLRWRFLQKQVQSPAKGVVFDTYYRQGEQVPAMHPVLSLIEADKMRIDFFVPTARLSQLRSGEKLRLIDSSTGQRLGVGTISYIAPQAEFTPPVIYSEKRMQEMMYRVEAAPQVNQALRLHLGQPVTVELCHDNACD